MCIAAQKVNATKYASLISGLKNFLRWLALPDGRVCDVVDVTGRLWRSQVNSGTAAAEGGFLALPIAFSLLAGA